VGGAVNTFYANKKTAALHADDQKQIAGLQKAIETANKNQEDNTTQFVQSFTNLSQKLSDLQSQVKTAGLQQEAAKLKAELESTRKALNPQKAELESSLGNITDKLEHLEVKEASVLRNLDGSLVFAVTVVNKSNVQASNGSVYLRICEGCTFAEEPARFIKPVGAENHDRQMMFQALDATTGLKIPLKIKPPGMKNRIELEVTLRCGNCTVRPPESLFVNY